MLRLTALLLALLATFASCKTADPTLQSGDTYPEDLLDAARLEADLRFLASDELRGRDTGTEEIDVAARYLAEQFRAAGAEPAPGTSDYFQSVPLIRIGAAEDARLTIAGTTFTLGQNLVVLSSDAVDLSEEAVYLDYGLFAPEQGIDDYAGHDLDGKVVVTRFGGPAERPELTEAARASNKLKRVEEGGGVALVQIYEGRYGEYEVPFPRIAAYLGGARLDIDGANPELPHVLVSDPGDALPAALGGMASPRASLQTSGRAAQLVRGRNVAAVIRGSDPERRDEFVAMVAHYDHVGVQTTNTSPADSIYNGARDNGMGTVGLLAAARAFAANPPARSMLLLAVTAEEKGLLGARYYVQNPLVPLEQTVFVLNADGAGYTDTSIVTVIGIDRTGARDAIETAAQRYGLSVIDDPAPEQDLFNRSDNVEFARRGVPAPTFSPGFRAFDAALMKYYHQPADEVNEDFDLAYFVRYVKAYAHAARRVADADQAPEWAPGDPYEAAGRRLYDAD